LARPKISHYGVVVASQQHIGWLQVHVHEPRVMYCDQPLRDFQGFLKQNKTQPGVWVQDQVRV
jgi:hypothetical protein